MTTDNTASDATSGAPLGAAIGPAPSDPLDGIFGDDRVRAIVQQELSAGPRRKQGVEPSDEPKALFTLLERDILAGKHSPVETASGPSEAAIRLECLKLAAHYETAASHLVVAAEALAFYVRTGRRHPGPAKTGSEAPCQEPQS